MVQGLAIKQISSPDINRILNLELAKRSFGPRYGPAHHRCTCTGIPGYFKQEVLLNVGRSVLGCQVLNMMERAQTLVLIQLWSSYR